MSNPKNTIHEIHRVLKPEGTLLALLLNPNSNYVQQKMNDPDSYIGQNVHAKTIESIPQTISYLFTQTKSWFDLSIKNDEIVIQSSNDEKRLIVMKAIK